MEELDISLEYQYLFSALMRKYKGIGPSPSIEAYVRANQILIEVNPPQKLESRNVDIYKIICMGLDAEAIEYFLRSSVGLNILSQKFHILIYLLEVNPNYYHCFINERSQFIRATFTLIFFAFRSCFKYFKGWYLTRRYSLV